MTKEEARESSPLLDALERSRGKSDQQLALELASAQSTMTMLLTLTIICGIISFVSLCAASVPLKPSNDALVICVTATLLGAIFLGLAGFTVRPGCTIQRLALDLRTYRVGLEERLGVAPPPAQESALAAHPTAAPMPP